VIFTKKLLTKFGKMCHKSEGYGTPIPISGVP